MNHRTWLLLYHYCAGLSGTLTGLLLLFAPAWTLHRIGVTQVPQPIFIVSCVGVFVLCVGATYFWVPVSRLTRRWPAACWRTQWFITALFRAAVALFVFSEIAIGAIEHAWAAVVLTDAVFAAIQFLGLRRDWLAFTD
jgi:hypothetical protein